MADLPLNYGHFGHATYRLEDSEWSFTRQNGTDVIAPLGFWAHTLSSTVQFPSPHHIQDPRSVQRATRRITRDFPQLAPATELLPEDALLSAATTSTAATYDPTVGNLLSFGSIAFEGHYENARRAAALPTGEAGNILRLVLLQKEKQGWGIDKTIWVEGYSMTDSESGYWNEDAVPIQQVCFAQSEDRSSFLAVRLPRRTVLFRPTYQHRRTPAHLSKHYLLPPSVFNIRPILNIDMEQTGGIPHADVTFNPHFQRQFGIIDQKGTWSVWDIEDGQRGGKYSVTCAVLGSVVSPDSATASGKNAHGDGWARIIWSGDANTIAVCNRRQIRVFDIRSRSVTPLKSPELITKRSPAWILDVKSHPRNRHQLFVLTSTHLYLLGATCLSDISEHDAPEAGVSVLLSWRHFRGLEDITLQLCIPATSDEESIVVIHSRSNNMRLCFRFHDESGRPFSMVDPALLNLELGMPKSTVENSDHVIHLHMDPLEFGEHDRETHVGPGRSYFESNIKFYRLSVLRSNFSIHTLLLYSPASQSAVRSEAHIEPTMWNKVVHPRRAVHEAGRIDPDSEFVVPEGLDALSIPILKDERQLPVFVKGRGRTASHNTIDHNDLYHAVTDTADGTVSPTFVDLTVLADSISHLLHDDSSANQVLGTLMEFAGQQIQLADVDEASLKMQELLSPDSHADKLELQRIASGHVLGLAEGSTQETPTVTSLYDAILRSWIAPLPPAIPVPVRQKKERLARRVAAEAILASIRIRHKTNQPLVSVQPGPSPDSAVPLPSAHFTISGESQNTSRWPSLPTSSILPIFSSAPTAPLTIPTSPVTDPIARLSRHLSIVNPQTTPIPPSISQVLTHWQTGSDPGGYDWEATERAINDELELEEEGTQERREKARRKKQRQEKRQRREDELMREKTLSHTQFPRSSPGPFTGGLSSQTQPQSQSQSQGGFLVQSQAEPGKHGRRSAKKKKIKSRISGF